MVSHCEGNVRNKNIEDIFRYSLYTPEQYQEDRKNYLKEFKLKFKTENKKALEKELNKEVELTSLEMEF